MSERKAGEIYRAVHDGFMDLRIQIQREKPTNLDYVLFKAQLAIANAAVKAYHAPLPRKKAKP